MLKVISSFGVQVENSKGLQGGTYVAQLKITFKEEVVRATKQSKRFSMLLLLHRAQRMTHQSAAKRQSRSARLTAFLVLIALNLHLLI